MADKKDIRRITLEEKIRLAKTEGICLNSREEFIEFFAATRLPKEEWPEIVDYTDPKNAHLKEQRLEEYRKHHTLDLRKLAEEAHDRLAPHECPLPSNKQRK